MPIIEWEILTSIGLLFNGAIWWMLWRNVKGKIDEKEFDPPPLTVETIELMKKHLPMKKGF